MMPRPGKAEGITATPHKLCRLLYALIEKREEYSEKTTFAASEKTLANRLRNIKKQGPKFGMQLVEDPRLASENSG